MQTFVNKQIIGITPITPCKVLQGGLFFYNGTIDKKFNLPVGIFNINGKFEVSKPIDYTEKIKFLRPEKKVKFLGIKKEVFTENVNKCSTFIDKGLIVWDKDFYNSLNPLMRKFVRGHELGHYFYFTEKKCDYFSRCMLLIQGYNPSQVNACTYSTLADNNRSNFLYKTLIKSKYSL